MSNQSHIKRVNRYLGGVSRYRNAYITESIDARLRVSDKLSPLRQSDQKKFESEINGYLDRIEKREWNKAAREFNKAPTGFNDYKALRQTQYDRQARVSEIRSQIDKQISVAIQINKGKNLSKYEMNVAVRGLIRNPKRLNQIAKQQLGKNRQALSKLGDYDQVDKNIQRLISGEATKFYRASQLLQIGKNKNYGSIEIFLSPEHVLSDMCDDLVGFYPKDFVFSNFHVNCKCGVRGAKPILTDVPQNFKDWIRKNAGRIKTAKYIPDFITENLKYL